MKAGTSEYIIQLDDTAKSYKMDDGLRKTLSLYYRLFYRSDYENTCKEAQKYYQSKLITSINTDEQLPPPILLVEKLLNGANN